MLSTSHFSLFTFFHLIYAKKSYGQHFLNNKQIAQDIADAMQSGCRNVLEVGPGRGMLTQCLLSKDIQLRLVEADKDMVDFLTVNMPTVKDNIYFNDFLQMDFSELFENEQFVIIGNYPYNISSQIIFKAIEHRERVPELVGMFQKEVAERIVAKPDSKAYGIISVLTQAFFDGTYLFTVDKSSFNPPPKVQSGVIRLLRKDDMNLGCSPVLFKTIVKQAFSQRRKMLRNTLKGLLPDTLLSEKFYERRAETLSVAEFVQLTNLSADK
jgi:16S rRNA (adenine1518-N6/adenine1519-N6)-dimethyltransferase